MCDCVYCRTAKHGVVDFPAAVVGMKLADAEAFLKHHRRSYTIERRDGAHPAFMPLVAYEIYLEVNGEYVVAAHKL